MQNNQMGDQMNEMGGDMQQSHDDRKHMGHEMKEDRDDMQQMGEQDVGDERTHMSNEMKEVLGDETQQMGAEINQKEGLGDDLIERIFLRLPILSCIKCASLSKHWYATISSPGFSARMSLFTPSKYPFLLLWYMNPVIKSSCMYDPIAARWFNLDVKGPILTFFPPIDTHPFLFSRTRFGLLMLNHFYTPNSHVEAQIPCPPLPTECAFTLPDARSRYVVSIFDSSTSLSLSFKVIIHSVFDNTITLYLYDSTTKKWEIFEALPLTEEVSYLLGPPRMLFLPLHIEAPCISSAVVGRKMYFADIYLGTMTCFDVDNKTWSKSSRLRAPDVAGFVISSTNKGLYALGFSATDECLKLYKVDEFTMECKEVSKMPNHLWLFLCNQFQDVSLAPSMEVFSFIRCVGSGNLVYVHNNGIYRTEGSGFSQFRACVCDVDDGYTWHQVPGLPSSLPKSPMGAQCCSFQMLPMACLRLTYEQGR